MAGLSWLQTRLLSGEIRKIYGRSYLPLRTSESTITMGDVLTRRKDIVPYLDGSLFGDEAIKVTAGEKVDRNIVSSKNVEMSFKAAGTIEPNSLLKEAEAGMTVKFTSQNQLFLKVIGMRQETVMDYPKLHKAVLTRYIEGGLPANTYVVHGLVKADMYLLVFGGKSGGEVGLEFKGKPNTGADLASINVEFGLKWTKSVGYNIDAPNGGPLAYRVSAIRINRCKRNVEFWTLLQKGATEPEILNGLTFKQREVAIEKGEVEFVPISDELINDLDSENNIED
jgi:hypothetical protein